MNEYNINVDFTKGRILTNLKRLVQNDYNTTKLNFTFDKEGRVLFKMLYPDGTQYVDEIQNNELIFDKGVLNQEGTYEYEISLYTGDGRLTDYTVKSFEVRNELVDTDELVEADDRVPVLDTLINEIETIKQDVEEGKYNGKDGVDGKTPNISIGTVTTLESGAEAQVTQTGTIEEPVFNFALPSGEKGEAGGVSLEEVKEIRGIYTFKNNTSLNSNSINLQYILGDLNKIINNELGNVFTIYVWFGEYKYEFNILIDKPTENGTISIDVLGVREYRTEIGKKKFVMKYNTTSDGKIEVTEFSSASNYEYYPLLDPLNALTTTNTTAYAPTKDYHPATKKYVDDLVGESGGSGITELTDYELVLSNLEVGVYILNGVYRIRYGSKTDVITTTLYKPILIVSQTINNGTGVNIGYLFNANNINIYDSKQGTSKSIYGDFLSKTNTTEYIPTDTYHPATKGYVDTAITNAITTSLEGSY